MREDTIDRVGYVIKARELAIEVTPEMIDAGVLVDRRYGWDDELGDEEDRIRDIFVAMVAAQKE